MNKEKHYLLKCRRNNKINKKQNQNLKYKFNSKSKKIYKKNNKNNKNKHKFNKNNNCFNLNLILDTYHNLNRYLCAKTIKMKCLNQN